MSRAAHHLIEARAARDAARSEFDGLFHRLRGDPEAETIGERLIGRVGVDARGSVERALDVAAESKGIAAATAAVLALWFLRGPILAWASGIWHGAIAPDDEFDNPDEVT